MPIPSRRAFVCGLLSTAFAGARDNSGMAASLQPLEPNVAGPAGRGIAALYGAVEGEPFPVAAIDLKRVNSAFLRAVVNYGSAESPGTIVIDPQSRYLYLVQEGGRALRYGVGVGREGFAWSGEATIKTKQEWPDWYPPKEMLERQPELRRQMSQLQSGIGMPGGPGNPLGARAMYLWQDNKDTLFRIHGTVEPWTIGKRVSSGCIRMINQDAIDLYNRVLTGTQVVVLGAGDEVIASRRPQGEAPVHDPLRITPDPYAQQDYDPYQGRGYAPRRPPPYDPYQGRSYPYYRGDAYGGYWQGGGYDPYRSGYRYDQFGRPYPITPGDGR
jgi:lipoprotein-anchoring transpeptidase ErfK/SrfK